MWLPGGGGGSGMDWELRVKDASYCFWNGLTMRSCCVALRTMSRYLQCSTTMGEKIMYTCMCNWVPMLYNEKKIIGEITVKKKKDIGEDEEKRKPFCTVGEDANWCCQDGKQYGSFSKD